MCSNYRPVTRMDRLLTFFGVERGREDTPPKDAFPASQAPFIRLAAASGGEGQPALVAEDGYFGLLPHFATEIEYGRRTYNARSETVARLPSFKPAWTAGQRCIVPVEWVYEPCWETGRAVRWRIEIGGGVPMGIAGIYRLWTAPDGTKSFSFAMLTVNADAHPLMGRMHRPGEEKRMVVILDRTEYGPWLTCTVAESLQYIKRWEGPLEGHPDPMPPRATRVKPVLDVPAEPGDLFD